MADTKKYIKRIKENDGTLRYFKDEDAREDIEALDTRVKTLEEYDYSALSARLKVLEDALLGKTLITT